MNNPICLFDSGIGGLTVLKKLLAKFPNEDYIYLADLARVPFGDRSENEIKNIVLEITEWLIKFDPKLILMACNTSSTIFSSQLPTLSSKFKVPIYGMLESCANEIASKHSFVSVWATRLAVEKNGYKNAIQKLNLNIKVEEIACPKLVPMIEDLHFTIHDRNEVINEYLGKTSKKAEALILGCTHYPLITEDIRNLTKIKIIDPTDSLVKDIEKILPVKDSNKSNPKISLYSTAQAEKLEKFAKLYLCGNYKANLVALNKVTA